ncbi:MAG: HlyC/CorC family transporter [Magnetococcales bacterium]|nr:HlyC/CorC family transporter [Magnetococcales bacterium]
MVSEILILLVLLLFSAFFSGSETALTTLSSARVEVLLREGRPGARTLSRIKSNTNRLLITLLIGNTVVNIAASAITTVLAHKHFGDLGTSFVVGVLTLGILFLCEIVPKTFAARYAVTISLRVAPFVLFFIHLTKPMTWFMEHLTVWLQKMSPAQIDPTVTESELISMARHGAAEGSIERDEHIMIQRIFAFDDLRAEDVMIPRHRIFSLNGSLTIREALPEFLEHPHSRVPLHTGLKDEIHRVAHLREILVEAAQGNWDKTLEEIAQNPLFVPLNQPVDALFNTLRGTKKQTVIVVDEFGQLQGLFTLEDMLEELVGEIYDELDKPPESIQEVREGELLVEGTVEVRSLAEYFGKTLSGKPSDIISLWILEHVQRIPTATERFVIDGLEVTIVRVTRRRILQVRVAIPMDEKT